MKYYSVLRVTTANKPEYPIHQVKLQENSFLNYMTQFIKIMMMKCGIFMMELGQVFQARMQPNLQHIWH